jgi:hypothetical protein
MSSITGFWKRVGGLWDHMLRRNGGGGPGLCVPPVADSLADSDGNGAHPPALPGAPRGTGNQPPRPGGWLLRNATQQRVIELMDVIQTHFQRQDLRAQALAAAVERVASTLERLSDSQRAQGECLAAIAGQVSDASAQVAALVASLRELPGSVHEQVQALRLLARQMESSQQVDVQMVQSLGHFSSTLDSLRASGTAAVRSLERLHETEREQSQSLRSFIREQNRRLLIVTLAAAGLGVAALAALTVVVSMWLGR